MKTPKSQLPGILGRIAEVCGMGVALMLARELGGTTIVIPSKPKPHHQLVRVVGLEAARLIAKHIGHGRVLIPMAGLRGQGGRRAAVARLQANGMAATKAALAADVHERTAWRARGRLRRKNLPLFD